MANGHSGHDHRTPEESYTIHAAAGGCILGAWDRQVGFIGYGHPLGDEHMRGLQSGPHGEYRYTATHQDVAGSLKVVSFRTEFKVVPGQQRVDHSQGAGASTGMADRPDKLVGEQH